MDDEPSIVRSLDRILTDRGYKVESAGSAARGMELLASVRPQVVLLDLNLPDGHGMPLIKEILVFDPAIRVIVITAFGDLKLGIEAMKAGANDFLKKPYEMDELILAVDNAARAFESQVRLDIYSRREAEIFHGQHLIGESPPMVRLLDIVERVAGSNATTVLILGESGTGKELVARAIHYGSERKNAPLMEVNCSAFQETLLENELFGHERGAYTDARELKKGLVELCDGGTLFLDEVADMPLATQAKLLRFLENQTFKRVGGGVDLRVDLRIVTATNKDLATEIAAGNFREDLFYRLKVVSLELPRLTDRGDDVLLIARWYLRQFNQKFKKSFREIAPEAGRLIGAYRWPGNVRELKNVLERLVLLENDTVLRVEHLPAEIREAGRNPAFRRMAPAELLGVDDVPTLARIEDDHIRRVLLLTGGNKSHAARLLGISRQGLFERLKRVVEPVAATEQGVK
ncbi:MAG: sigma-54 dependent transcriptional regulator [Candidatus Eisenbacteria bacterium]|nr:sigma-54 dependent transcriptional regulator [Candidatus Eisenbacteria bacterium]